jgi:hypothetical protein
MQPNTRRSLAVFSLTALAVVAATTEHASAQRRPRRPPQRAVPRADAGAPAQPAPRGDDPTRSSLTLNNPLNLRTTASTLTLSGSRSWTARTALAWMNEDRTLNVLVHSENMVCPAAATDRARLANALQLNCPGGACRMLLLVVPTTGALAVSSAQIVAPAAQAQSMAALSATLTAVDRNNPAAMQAAVAQLQAQQTRPTTAMLAWQNTSGESMSEAATGGTFAITAVRGRAFDGTFSVRFADPPSPNAAGAPTLDGRFTLTLCP